MPPKKFSPLSKLFQDHKNMAKQNKKHNAAAKSADTGVESDPPSDIEIAINSNNADNANIVIASGSIDPVVESETHENACNVVVDAINNTGNSEINTGSAVEATAATGKHNFNNANTTCVINCTNTAETSFAGDADAVMNDNINKDGDEAVDVITQVSVHMSTLFLQVSNFVISDDILF
jgi:hypothetical protein